MRLGLISSPRGLEAGVVLGAVVAIKVEEEVILMALHIDREGVKAVWECLVSKFLLPLGPLIIEDIIQGRDSIPLLPLVQEIDVGRGWIETVQLCLGAQNVLGVESGLDPELGDIVGVVQ